MPVDSALLKKLLEDIDSNASVERVPSNNALKPGNNEYQNDAEHLRSLMNWVHEAKETGEGADAMQLFVEAQGLEIIVKCMKRNLGDTIVENRALEILAGEKYANGSLPLLEEAQVCTKLIQLGLLSILLDVLRLPDLQAISRGLGCNALRILCTADPSAVPSVVDGDGVDVLLGQICHVDRGFAFAALSILVRNSTKARNQVRDAPGSLPNLLKRFAQKPTDYAPQGDPAASILFISTWTWPELQEQFKELGEVGFEAYDLLEAAHLRQYNWRHMFVDAASSLSDFSTEVGNSYFYIKTGRYEFLILSSAGIVFNTIMSTVAIQNISCGKGLLNILTLGYYNLVMEGKMCWDNGLKSPALTGLKIFKGINSMIRFFVSAYSLLLAGYAGGFPELDGLQLATRWASLASSLVFLPAACRDAVVERTLPGQRDFGHSFLRFAKRPSFAVILLLYQGSEIWAQMTLIIFQVVASPYGLYINWVAHISLLFLAVLIFSRCQANMLTFVNMPMAIFWTINGGATSDLQIMSRAGGFLRILSLSACWTYIGLFFDCHQSLVDHFTRKSSLGLVVIALGGTVVHLITYFVQLYVGRWKFEHMHSGANSARLSMGDVDAYTRIVEAGGGDLEMQRILLNSQDVDGQVLQQHHEKTTGGLYDTTSQAPLVVADRWKLVHESLASATARVPRDPFVNVHKQIAAMSAPTRNSDDGSPYANFLDLLFTAATGLMLPKKKDDLGKHCYGYSSLISDEYYESPDPIPDKLGLLSTPAIGWFDPLKVIRIQLQDDWSAVSKDDDNHVDRARFKESVMRRHEVKLGGISEATTAFDTFVDRIFEALRCISGRDDQQWLDQHSFTYGSLLAYEFYFSDARDAVRAEGCGSSTPVADNLGITVPIPSSAAKK